METLAGASARRESARDAGACDDVPSRLLRARCMGVGLTKLTRCLGTNSTLRTLECSQVREASFVLVRRPRTSPSPEPNPAQARKPPQPKLENPYPQPQPQPHSQPALEGAVRGRARVQLTRDLLLSPRRRGPCAARLAPPCGRAAQGRRVRPPHALRRGARGLPAPRAAQVPRRAASTALGR